jgi:hypothetical protein
VLQTGWPADASGADNLARIWLSNLNEDPGEKRNLGQPHANLVDELFTDLHRWRGALPNPID